MSKTYRLIAVDIICGFYILLFVYAALSKLLEFEKFNIQLTKSPVLGPYAGLLALAVPAIEIGLSILLSFRRFQFCALYASLTLMGIFSSYIVAILKFSEFIPCSCGGILEHMTWIQHLYFNIAFIILAIVAVFTFPIDTKKLLRDNRDKPKPLK